MAHSIHYGPVLHLRQFCITEHDEQVPFEVIVSATRPDEHAVHIKPLLHVRQLGRLLQGAHVVGVDVGKAYPEMQLKQFARLHVEQRAPYKVMQSTTHSLLLFRMYEAIQV